MEGALEDFDVEKLKNIKLEYDPRTAKELIKGLQENLVIVQNKRKKLHEKMQNDDDEKETLRDIANKLRQENSNMKNEVQDMTMRLCKDIEDRKKNEEDLTRRLNDAGNENLRLSHEIDMIKTNLIHMQYDKDELVRQVGILENELITANEHKDRFKKISERLDDMLKR